MTPQMRDCLHVIALSIDVNGRAPSRRDLEIALNAEEETVSDLVSCLVADGHLVRDGRRYETLRLGAPISQATPAALPPRQAGPRTLMPFTTWAGERPASPNEHGMPTAAWDGEKLGPGEVCGDCVDFRKCRSLLEQKRADTRCNWSPSRWRDAVG